MTALARIARIGSFFQTFVLSAIGLISLTSAASPASAQCPGQWIPGQQSIGGIYAFATLSNGDLYAGGSQGVFRWTGSSWVALPGITGIVRSLVNFNGELVAGGSNNAAGVRRWNGQTWTSLGPASGYVAALTVFNNDLVAGGMSGGSSVARWDGTNWHPIGSLLLLSEALTVYNGSLISGGYHEGGITGAGAWGIGIWNGTAWHTLGSGVGGGSNSPVMALVHYQGDLIAGGEFGGERMRRWNGTSWQSMNYTDGYVWALAAHQGDLFAGLGCQCPGIPSLQRLHNGTWQSISLGFLLSQSVTALESHGDDLFVGGTFGWGNYRTTCPRGDLNADGLLNDVDQTILIDVLLNIDDDPDHIARADLNDDDHTDGLDIAVFTACRTGGCP